jgi:hypothetical protein
LRCGLIFVFHGNLLKVIAFYSTTGLRLAKWG